MIEEHKKWVWVAIIGGILMFISSIVGSASFFALVFGIASKYLGAEAAMAFFIILIIFSIIAAGGGISVIIGALLVKRDNYKSGKFIIGLGAGLGLIGLIIFLIVSAWTGSLIGDFTAIIVGTINGSYGFLGVVLTILARMKLKKDK